MEIKTVAILGAGAVGCYFIETLHEKLGENLWVVADGVRSERLKQDGLVINHRKYELNLKTPKEAVGADLLVVAVKNTGLKEALDDIALAVGEETLVISPLNGVESEEMIAARIGKEHLIYSMIKISSERIGNEVRFNAKATQGLWIGCPGEKEANERMEALLALFSGTEFRCRFSPNILSEIWAKFCLNVGYNLPQAMVGCSFEAYEKSEHVAAMAEALRSEVIAIAEAKGITFSEETSRAGMVRPQARFSTLQDLDAGRRTEIDAFAGAVVRMGRQLGIPTPYNEMAYRMIRALEEKNEGVFRK